MNVKRYQPCREHKNKNIMNVKRYQLCREHKK